MEGVARIILETMKAEMEVMREEKVCMEGLLVAAETELKEKRRVLAEYQEITKLIDDVLEVVLEGAGRNNNPQENSQNLEEETMKELLEEAMGDFIVLGEMNGAQTRGTTSCPSASGGINGGEHGRGTSGQNLDGGNEAPRNDVGNHDGDSGANGGGLQG